jgi:hypothetical protein
MENMFNNILFNCVHRSFVNINDVNIFRITEGRNVLVANETEMIKIMREIISDAMTPFEHKIYT